MAGKCSLVEEEVAEVCEELARVIQLAPCHADHSPSCDLKAAVAFAVGLESRAGSVRLTAIQFDYEPLFSPEAVRFDLDPVEFEQDVELGSG